MEEMRRKDRATTQEEAIALLNRNEYGVLSCVSKDGEPYGIPLSYCVVDDFIYFHCATEGKKLEHFKHNKSVSFCVVGNTEILPDKFSTKYESVIVSGKIEEVFDDKKQIGLEGLVHKYSPEFIDKGITYIASAKEETKVFRIKIDSLTGKARK
ncbi:MAG: pyridoxamine 5'-phosphate oxidase family protein [Melioribacteraceae bacterium]|nr:pyridoxamine 5'-phosphate oxidase family protein [Melioribacteraceae bacterium]